MIPQELSHWLNYPGSFMERLKQYHVNDAEIHVVREGWELPTMDESSALSKSSDVTMWIREVSIQSGETVWMYARTVIPKETLTGEESELQHLQTRSLGSILFKNPALHRSEFEFFCIKAGTKWHEKITQDLLHVPDILWARRSVFSIHEKSLLLIEIFFPEIAKLC